MNATLRNALSLTLLAVLPLPASGGDVASKAPSQKDKVRQVVGRAVRYLEAESADWLKTRKCAACHHAPMPMWALSEARNHGYPINDKYLADTTESLLGSKEKLLASRVFPNPAEKPDPRPQGRGLNMALPFLVVAAQSMPSTSPAQRKSLDLVAEEILKKQQPDGSWEFFATLRRPPINENQITDMVWIILALQGDSHHTPTDAERQALKKATEWLAKAKPSDCTQDGCFRLFLAIRNGRPTKEVQSAVDKVTGLQRPDGGWSQLPGQESDAFATGQALYALSLSGASSARASIDRGVGYLVAAQKPDGTWPMKSRSSPNGEPGSSKNLSPITCAAASWATLGLATAVPLQK